MATTSGSDGASPPPAGMKIAISGKGGSGKTMLTAIMTGLLASSGGLKLLVIDADSAVNLPYALGIEPSQTVAAIRRQIIEDPAVKAEMQDKSMRTVMQEALEQGDGFQLLAMGRPEGPGCYCAINDLLRYGIERLSRQFDITLIDCEAGPEQVNRRVVNGVDVLLIVTDASIRGAQVVGSIAEVIRSDGSIRPGRAGVVINRLRRGGSPLAESATIWGLEVMGRIPEDENVTEYDSVGRPIVELPDSSPSVAAVRELLKSLSLV